MLPLFATTPTSAASISLSQTSDNVAIIIPQEGGIGVGAHNITVVTDNSYGYNVLLTSSTDNTAMVGKNGQPTITPVITTTGSSNNPWGYVPLGNNQFGRAVVGNSVPANPATGFYPASDYTSIDQSVLSQALFGGLAKRSYDGENHRVMARNTPTPSGGDHQTIYYGVRIDHPDELISGDYSIQVVYTATVYAALNSTATETDTINDPALTTTGNTTDTSIDDSQAQDLNKSQQPDASATIEVDSISPASFTYDDGAGFVDITINGANLDLVENVSGHSQITNNPDTRTPLTCKILSRTSAQVVCTIDKSDLAAIAGTGGVSGSIHLALTNEQTNISLQVPQVIEYK